MHRPISRSARLIDRAISVIASEARKAWVRLRYPGVSFVRGVRLAAGVDLRAVDGGTVRIGDGAFISAGVLIRASVGNITIGERAFVGRGVHIAAVECVEIGADCLIAEHATVRDQDHDYRKLGAERNRSRLVAPVRLGTSVWLAAKVTVVKGTSIGQGSVIGANSVARGEIAPFSVAVGCPARVVDTIDPR